MKATLHRNIDLVRIQVIPGVREYAFPQNVDWAGKKIEKLIFCPSFSTFASAGGVAYDPMDGVTPIANDLNGFAQRDAFLTLVNSKGVEIMHDVALAAFNFQAEIPMIEVNDVLDLSLCRIRTTSAPANKEVALFYVVWGDKEVEDYDLPLNSLTVTFPMSAGEELTFRELINNYISAMPNKVKGIIAWNATSNPAYLTLRDKTETYIFRNVHTQLMEPARCDIFRRIAPQLPDFYLDDIDIDFDYSRIRNAQNQACTQQLTFLY